MKSRLGHDRNYPIYEQHIAWAEYRRMMQSLALDIPTHQLNWICRTDDIRISHPAPIMRAGGETIELARMSAREANRNIGGPGTLLVDCLT